VKAHQAEHRIATMCHVVGVSTSGYYAWRDRAPSARERANADLQEKIRVAHKESRGSYVLRGSNRTERARSCLGT